MENLTALVSSLALATASSLASAAGPLRLLPFVSIFTTISSTPSSSLAHLAWLVAVPIMASHVPSFSSHSESLAASCNKAFVVGPGHAPIKQNWWKNYQRRVFRIGRLTVQQSPCSRLRAQSFLDGKLLVSKKRWLVEVEDICTWTEVFTINQMVICASHPHCWYDLTKHKLLIIQNAHHLPGHLCLEYGVAFWKDAAATGACDWLRMNLDLYNFHLHPPSPPLTLPSSSGSPLPFATNQGSSACLPYCNLLNRGQCLRPFGDCRFCHSCRSCNGVHPWVRCPVHSPGTTCSPSPATGGRPWKGTVAHDVSCT